MSVIHTLDFASLTIFGVCIFFIFEQLNSCGHMREGQIVTAVECLENSSLQISTVLQFCKLKILPLSEK